METYNSLINNAKLDDNTIHHRAASPEYVCVCVCVCGGGGGGVIVSCQ